MLFTGDDPKPYSPSLYPPDSSADDIFDSMTDLPPDPLLNPGAFIDDTVVVTSAADTETLIDNDISFDDHVRGDDSDNSQRTASPHPVVEKKDVDPLEEAAAVDEGEFGTPVYVKRAVAVKVPGRRGRRKKSEMVAATVDASSSAANSEIPDWLPAGWFIEDRVRVTGVSAGAKDKYFCDSVSGKRFRSRKEVLQFLETGGRPKRVLREKTAEDDMQDTNKPRTSTRKRKEKDVASNTGNQSSNFDFENVPESVGWVLTGDTLQGSWTPFIGKKKVTKKSENEWAATFNSLSSSTNSRR